MSPVKSISEQPAVAAQTPLSLSPPAGKKAASGKAPGSQDASRMQDVSETAAAPERQRPTNAKDASLNRAATQHALAEPAPRAVGDSTLSGGQFEAIKAFCDKIILAPDHKWSKVATWWHHAAVATAARTYDDPLRDPAHVGYAKLAMGEAGFAALQAAVADPCKVAAFGIKNPGQNAMARSFLRTVIKNTVPVDATAKLLGIAKQKTFNDMLDLFAAKHFVEPYNVKDLLLLRADPVKPLRAGATAPSVIDVILAHVHFDDLDPSPVAGLPAPDRPTNRALIANEFTRLAEHPHLATLFACFAAIIRREKGAIFISNDIGSSSLRAQGHRRLEGFYNRHHSVFVRDLINWDHKVIGDLAGTVVHEMAHMVFGRIIGQEGDPAASAEQAKTLDAALAQDRAHRAALDYEQLPDRERHLYNRLALDLEHSTAYFPGGYQEKNPQQRALMRTEAIVRPLQFLAWGGTLEQIQRVTPHLWGYLQTHTQPLMQAYAEDAVRDGWLTA